MPPSSPHPTTAIDWIMITPEVAVHVVFDTDTGPPRTRVTLGINGIPLTLPSAEATWELNKGLLMASLVLTSASIHHDDRINDDLIEPYA